MKKTLSVLTVLGIAAIVGTQTADAFEWSSLNPAYWGHCPKCEKKKPKLIYSANKLFFVADVPH